MVRTSAVFYLVFTPAKTKVRKAGNKYRTNVIRSYQTLLA
jgi:hypothetical protein